MLLKIVYLKLAQEKSPFITHEHNYTSTLFRRPIISNISDNFLPMNRLATTIVPRVSILMNYPIPRIHLLQCSHLTVRQGRAFSTSFQTIQLRLEFPRPACNSHQYSTKFTFLSLSNMRSSISRHFKTEL